MCQAYEGPTPNTKNQVCNCPVLQILMACGTQVYLLALNLLSQDESPHLYFVHQLNLFPSVFSSTKLF